MRHAAALSKIEFAGRRGWGRRHRSGGFGRVVMNDTNRLILFGMTLVLGVVLALAAVVMTWNSPVHANSHPDLEVGTPSVDVAGLHTGHLFTLYVTVTNAGGGESESTRLRYYRSTDSTITSSDTEQGSKAVGALAAAGTSDHPFLNAAPSEAGTYYYGACVDSVTDESDTTNNCSSSVTVTVSEVAPDLVVIEIAARPSSLDPAIPGENDLLSRLESSFQLSAWVQNVSDGYSRSTTLEWKISTDATITSSDTSVAAVVTGSFQPYQQEWFAAVRLWPPSTPGTYYYGGCVDSVRGESDTTNNCSRSVTVTVNGPETNSPARGAPTISGTAQVGETLTADTSGILDADGLDNVSYNYQWLASRDTEIDGATSSTYTLQSSNNRKVIKVRVTFTDDAGNEESLTSAGTSAVVAANAATGTPTISGTVQVGQTLNVDTSGIADEDGLDNVSYSYQWLADGANISGATGPTYALVAADVRKAIKVRVTFTDDAGNQESITSDPTEKVPGIWGGTVTVGSDPASSGAVGYSAFAIGMGSITAPDFVADGEGYTVDAVAYSHEGLHLALSRKLSTPFTLHIRREDLRFLLSFDQCGCRSLHLHVGPPRPELDRRGQRLSHHHGGGDG